MDRAKFWSFAKSDAGIVIPNAEVEVFIGDGVSKPTLYADREGTEPLTNPFNAEDNGFFEFYVEGGRYRVEMGAEGATFVLHNVLVGTAQGLDVEAVVSPGDLHPVAASGDHTDLSNVGSNSHAQIDAHIASEANPHDVTKSQVGLGNVDNVSASDLRDRATHTGTQAISTVSGLQSELDGKADQSDLDSHVNNPDIHREINDSGTGATDLWSAEKIAAEIDNVEVGTIATDSTLVGDGSSQSPAGLADRSVNRSKLSVAMDAQTQSAYGSWRRTELNDLSGAGTIDMFGGGDVDTVFSKDVVLQSNGFAAEERDTPHMFTVNAYIDVRDEGASAGTFRLVRDGDGTLEVIAEVEVEGEGLHHVTLSSVFRPTTNLLYVRAEFVQPSSAVTHIKAGTQATITKLVGPW